MRLYVSVPCYDGKITTRTVASLMSTLPRLMNEGIIEDYNINFHGEALINRCRNKHANIALRQRYDKLITIDSDIEFTYDNIKRLVTSPHKFVGGSYPLKCLPAILNFNPLPDKGTELSEGNKGYGLKALMKFREKYADSEGVAEVRDVPTGFLCVSSEVLWEMTKIAEQYVDYYPDIAQIGTYYDLYPTKVIDAELLSEDWGHCHLARKAGFKVMFDTNVITSHVGGSHVYKMGQVLGTVDLNDTIGNNKL